MHRFIDKLRKKYYRIVASRWMPYPVSGLLLTERVVKDEVLPRREVG